jgi:hypothetical protein
MTDENTPQPTETSQLSPEERGSAWHLIQQGAQVFGETGVGLGGIATALHFAKAGGGGTPSQPAQPSAPPPDPGDKP